MNGEMKIQVKESNKLYSFFMFFMVHVNLLINLFSFDRNIIINIREKMKK